MAEEDVDALVELDGLRVRAAIDPFGEHMPEDPGAARVRAPARGHPGFLGAVERSSRRAGGVVSVRGARRAPRRARDRLPAAARTWGRGSRPRAQRRCCATRSRARVTRVYAHSLLDNAGSIRVMEKIGMTYAAPGPTAGCRAPSTRPGPRFAPRVTEAGPGTRRGPRSMPAAVGSSRLGGGLRR